jgi:hypothetical protein
MMKTEDFIEHYQGFTAADLLVILDNKKDYQQNAIEAAKQELNNRSLSSEELNAARQLIIDRKNKKSKPHEDALAFSGKIKSATNEIAEGLLPSSDRSQPLKTKLILLILLFSVISVYQIGSNSQWLLLYTRIFLQSPMASLAVLLPSVLLPVAILFFALRKKIGWILFAAFLTYSAVWSVRTLASSFHSNDEVFANLFPRPSFTAQIISLAFYLGTLFLISRSDIRDHYCLTMKTAFKVFAISWFVTVAIIFLSN